VTKPILNVSIVLTAVILGIFHYKIKPRPTEKEIGQEAQGMTSRVLWRGQTAPDFEITTTKGDRFRLSEVIGRKIVVLNFFATWCEPCRAEMPELNRYFNEHKSEPFILLGIDAEEKSDRVQAFLDELKVDFPAGVDDGPIRKQYGVDAYPTTVVIGVDGKVQFYETGGLANAEVAFDGLLRSNRQILESGKAISAEEYREQAQKQTALPLRQADNQTAEKYKLDDRGKRVIARMVCPCGCSDKVQACNCNTSDRIKKALADEDFKNEPDDEIIRSLNKRFCVGAM
jgi:peroxiredoxin